MTLRIFVGAVAILAGVALLGALGCSEESDDDAGAPPAVGGTLWVVDQGSQRVLMYDYTGELRWTISGPLGYFFKPNAVGVDRRDGSAWVLDYYVNKLRKYDKNGNRIYESPAPEGEEPLIRRATGLAVDQRDGACWVADRSHNRVLKLTSGGDVVVTVTGFNSPRAVALDAGDGSCWVADELNNRFVKIPAEPGAEVEAEAVALLTVGGFDTPWVVATDDDGGAWVADKGAGTVVKIDAGGGRTATITGFVFPADVALALEEGLVYVVDENAGDVVVFGSEITGNKSADAAAKLKLEGFSMPTDAEVDETGKYVFISDADYVKRYSMEGELLTTYEGAGLPVMAGADPGR
jgi:DNA-binding beta-propeller fold protein YncE